MPDQEIPSDSQINTPISSDNDASRKVFISYSRRDKEAIICYVDLLRANGLDVWIDESGINASSEWAEQIVSAITDCDVFLLFLSKTSVESENVRKEIGVAANLGKKILPLKIEDLEIPPTLLYHLNSLHFLETKNISHELLLEHVCKAAGSPKSMTEMVIPDHATHGKKRLPLVIVAVLLVVGLVVGLSLLNKDKAADSDPDTRASIDTSGAQPQKTGEPDKLIERADNSKGTRIAVLYFENNTSARKDLEPLSKALAHMVRSEAEGYDTYDFVERDELAKVLKELELSNSKNFDAGSAGRIGKLLGAEQLVLGSYMLLFDKFRINAKVVDVETGRILHSASAKGDAKNFDVMAEEISAKLFSKGQVATKRIAGFPSLPVDVALKMGQALQMIDEGNESEGLELLKKLQVEHPKSELLKNAIRLAE